MTDENTEKVADATVAVPVSAPRRGSAWGGLLLLLLFVAVAATGYFGWQQRQTVSNLQQQYESLAQANAGAGQQASSLTSAQQQLQQSVETLQAALEQLQGTQQQVMAAQQQQQNSVQQQVQAISATVNSQTAQLANIARDMDTLGMRLAETGDAVIRDQVLSEVDGMLRLAGQRLQVAQDIDTALALLRTSDELLSPIVESDIAALRTQLQGDMAALQAVMPIDVLALHQQLGAMLAQIDALHAVSATAQNDLTVPEAATTTDTAPQTGWLADTRDFLGRYFVITQRDAPITPLLSPEQDWLIRKNIALKLEQARLAVLARDTALFRTMLAEAQDGIETGLAGDGKPELLSALAALSTTELQMTLPSLANTLATVEQLRTRQPAALPAEVVQ